MRLRLAYLWDSRRPLARHLTSLFGLPSLDEDNEGSEYDFDDTEAW